jgi:hypothetical protein
LREIVNSVHAEIAEDAETSNRIVELARAWTSAREASSQ